MKKSTSLLYAQVIDGRPDLLPIMHRLEGYIQHESFLKWLKNNRITGKNLVEWLRIEHQGSLQNMVQFIIKNQNKNREYEPIMLGKDWV